MPVTPPRPSDQTPVLLALGSVSLVWGLNWVVMKTALLHAGAFEFAAMRLWLAVLLVFSCIFFLRRPWRVARPAAVALTGFFQTGLTTALTLWGLSTGSAGKNAVLCYAMPFWVALLAWPFLGERPSPRQWMAIGLAALGIGLLFGGDLHGTQAEFAALGSGMSWALGIVLTKKLNVANATDPLAFSAWQTATGAVALTLMMFILPGAAPDHSIALWSALIYNAVLVYGVIWFLWFWILQKLDAGVASLGTLAVPVVGVVSGMVFLSERPSPQEWAGIVLMLLALALTASVAAQRRV